LSVVKRNEIEPVEEWVSMLVDRAVRAVLKEAGYTLPDKIIFDQSFPSQGKRKPGRGEWWEGAASTNGVPRMIVPCDTADVETITDNVMYLSIFGAVGVKDGHGRAFNNCARRIGMDGPLPKWVPGPRLRERLNDIIADMPPFPRGALNFNKFKPSGEERNVAGRAAPQRGRMMKAECLLCSDEGAEYIARLSAQALREKGPPVCPVHKTPMWHAELPPLPGQGEQPGGIRPVTLPQAELIEHTPVLAIEYKPGEQS
jgi:hypothetical protein